MIESVNIQLGDHVADIGAGGGYFTFILADPVNPSGRVHAVDVEEEITTDLEDQASENNYRNAAVILGELDDPLLPDGTIDRVFLCNAHHHIERRVGYFSRLKADLKLEGAWH